MAGVTALRDAAREAIFAAGGRGFVRFAAEGDALLVSDACRRSDAAPLIASLEAAGFACESRDGLLQITPGDALLLSLCAADAQEIAVDWESALCDVQALCARLLREERLPLDGAGRRLVMETARLLWQTRDKVLSGLTALRAMIAVHLREGKRSGMNEAGRLLAIWLEDEGK